MSRDKIWDALGIMITFSLLMLFLIAVTASLNNLNSELIKRGVKHYHQETGELVWSGEHFQPVEIEVEK